MVRALVPLLLASVDHIVGVTVSENSLLRHSTLAESDGNIFSSMSKDICTQEEVTDPIAAFGLLACTFSGSCNPQPKTCMKDCIMDTPWSYSCRKCMSSCVDKDPLAPPKMQNRTTMDPTKGHGCAMMECMPKRMHSCGGSEVERVKKEFTQVKNCIDQRQCELSGDFSKKMHHTITGQHAVEANNLMGTHNRCTSTCMQEQLWTQRCSNCAASCVHKGVLDENCLATCKED